MKHFIYKHHSILTILFVLVVSFVLLFPTSATFAKDDTMESFLTDTGTQMGDYGTKKTLPVIIGGVIKTIFGILGVVLLIIVIYAGIMWMTAGGEVEKVQKAQRMLSQAIIGLFICFAGYAISAFVVGKLAVATGGISTPAP
ncbi:hypothetical protein HQ571_01935 [Candidatus Kuenenbacteria bacterium]|nr:hypothetical protein [Candidatus Kuenenbacteria bacterium]